MFASTGAHGPKFYLLSTTASVALFEPSQPIRTLRCSGVQRRVMTEVRHSDEPDAVTLQKVKHQPGGLFLFFRFFCFSVLELLQNFNIEFYLFHFLCNICYNCVHKKISKEDLLCAFVVFYLSVESWCALKVL